MKTGAISRLGTELALLSYSYIPILYINLPSGLFHTPEGKFHAVFPTSHIGTVSHPLWLR